MGDGGIHSGHNHPDALGHAFFRKVQHSREGLVAELTAHQLLILLGIGIIQRNGHHVDAVLQLAGDIMACNQAALAVGIDADGQGTPGFQPPGHLQQHRQGTGGLAKAAEYDLLKLAHIPLPEFVLYLLGRWLPLQPKAVTFPHMIHGLPQTEGAGRGTAVCQVYINSIMDTIQNFHVQRLLS